MTTEPRSVDWPMFGAVMLLAIMCASKGIAWGALIMGFMAGAGLMGDLTRGLGK